MAHIKVRASLLPHAWATMSDCHAYCCRSRTTSDFTVFVQVDPSDTGVRKVKSSMELPLSVATVMAQLCSFQQRREWDCTFSGVGGVVQRLEQLMACPASTAAELACTCMSAAPSTGRDVPSLLTLDSTGADSDSDEELLHERAARFISRSSVLSYLFKGVVERTENSSKYLDLELLPLLPDAGSCSLITS